MEEGEAEEGEREEEDRRTKGGEGGGGGGGIKLCKGRLNIIMGEEVE